MTRSTSQTPSLGIGPAWKEKFLRACRRVGATRKARLRWLVDFAKEEPCQASRADAARRELLAFAALEGLPEPIRPNALVRLARTVVAGDTAAAQPPPSLLDEEPSFAVGDLRRRIRKALRQLADRRRWTLPGTDPVYVWNDKGTFVAVPRVDITQPYDLSRWVYGAVRSLLMELSPRIGVCADDACRRLFVPGRRQAYWGKTSTKRVRRARYWERPRERLLDAQRTAYAQKRTTKLGPKVRVRRQHPPRKRPQ